MAKQEISVPAIAQRIRTEGDAYYFLEQLRWADGVTCPHCGHIADANRPHYFLRPANGQSRKTRTGSASERRVWKCRSCRKQFSVLTGTIFEGTKISVQTWLFVIFEMCSSKNGVAAREVERKYNVTAKTAWFMLHRIREAMKREPLAGLLAGTIVADETWIGGKPRNRHGSGRGKGTQGLTDKQPVVALVNKETGEVRSSTVANVTGATLRPAIEANVDKAVSHLHTDSANAYRQVGTGFLSHEFVNHFSGEYVRGDVSTNQAENFFSQLKRSIDGTHHHVSVAHLDRYLAEFDFRYSTRKDTDTVRMLMWIERVAGRRLTYKPLIGQAR